MNFRPRNYSGLIHGRLQRQLEMGIAVSFFSRFKTVWLSSFSSFWKELMACSERFLRWVPLSHWPSGALIASTVARSGGDCFPLISEVPRTLQGFVLCQDHFSLGHFPFLGGSFCLFDQTWIQGESKGFGAWLQKIFILIFLTGFCFPQADPFFGFERRIFFPFSLPLLAWSKGFLS